MRPELQKKIDGAIKLLRTMSKAYENQPIEVAYSGGKDSDVILQLTREAGIPYRAIYRNTTIDPPGTIKHVQEMGVEIVRPEKTFFQLMCQKGWPSRFARFCCSELKEYRILDKAILGIRKEESAKRAARYKEPTMCRLYRNNKGNRNDKCKDGKCAVCVEQILPILDWTLQDVQEFIEDRKIKLAPVYYREDGTIDFSRRLGCMCCPLASKSHRIDEFKAYPKMVRNYIRCGKIWWNAKPRLAQKKCEDIYEMFAHTVFGDGYSTRCLNKEALFKTDYKKALEDYFGIELP